MKAYAWLFNLLTVLVLGLTTLFCLWSGLTFGNPQFILNPLKPQSDALPAILPTSAPLPQASSPAKYPTMPPAWTATPAVTASPAASGTALATANATAVDTVTSAPTNTTTPATATPFPSPVGPTATLAPTDLPSRTPTLKPPPQTATSNFYPGGVTATLPPVTDTPVSYP